MKMKFLLHKDKEIYANVKIAHLANPTLKLSLRLPKELFLPMTSTFLTIITYLLTLKNSKL
jgi:hypothetical protein